MVTVENKTCCRCRLEKPSDAFANNKRQKDGLLNHCRECHKADYQRTRERQLEYAKQWAENNKGKLKARQKQYFQDNKQELIEKNLEYRKKRRKEDPQYALVQNLRSRINAVLSQKRFTKEGSFSEMLGCTPQELVNYLESKFEAWMSWDTRGLYNGQPCFGWDVDHITPLASAESIDEVKALNHYTNLQPLCSYVNRDIKKAKIQ